MEEEAGENPLFVQLDQLFKDNEVVPLADFYFKHIRDADISYIFPTQVIDSVFAVLCTDETKNFLEVTKKSYERAKKVFKFSPKSSTATDKLISDILNNDSASIDRAFFAFISEDIAKKILYPNQWLVRCDDEGFIITVSRREDPAAPVVYENHRVTYNEVENNYVLHYNGTDIQATDWQEISTKMNTFAASRAASRAPLFRVCDGSRIYNWREGEDDIIELWTGMVKMQYNEYLHCFRWFTYATVIEDPNKFFNSALEQCFRAHYNPHDVLDVIDVCIAHGADVNHKDYESIYNFAVHCGHQQWDIVADKIWQLGADPNTMKDGTPAFFIAAMREEGRASYFTRNPKLDVNIKDKRGLNVAWHCKEKIDLAVFNDKNLDFHEIRDGKSLLDHAIEVFKIPYIIKLIQSGIDVQRPSATGHGTYLHALLIRSKQNRNENIIPVIRTMIEAGINVQSLNSLYQTPLHIAAADLSTEIVRELIVTHKANPNGHQESDTTPLHAAAERGDVNMISTLLELGADQFIRNARGQIPREVALFAAKALFSKGNAPTYKFKAIKVAITNPPHPQYSTNVAVIGDYLYINEGAFNYLDWWDDYGFPSLQTFTDRVKAFERLSLNDILDKSKSRSWEQLEISKERFEESYRMDSFLKVNDKLWFNGKEHYLVFDPETQTWSQGLNRNRMVHSHRQQPHFHYQNKILHTKTVNKTDCTFVEFTDMSTGQLSHADIDPGDYAEQRDYAYRHAVLQDNIVWFVLYRTPKILYALNLELRRIFKVFEFDFELTSSFVCFGNRFLISITHDTDGDHKLFILDLQTMQHSLHDFTLDVEPEKDFNVAEDTKTRKFPQTNLEEKYNEVKDKLQSQLTKKIYPFGHASLAIYQTTLLIFGGNFENLLANSYLLAIDLSQLVPQLALEQHAALTVLKNMKRIDAAKLSQISDDLRNKTNLW